MEQQQVILSIRCEDVESGVEFKIDFSPELASKEEFGNLSQVKQALQLVGAQVANALMETFVDIDKGASNAD